MGRKTVLACSLTTALLLLGLLVLRGEAQAGPTTVIVIEDQVYPCKIIKHDEKKITVYLIDAKTTTTIEWDKLAPMERRRLKYLIKANDVTGSGRPLGRKIDGVEVTLQTRMSYRGMELKDRTSPSHRYFRFPRVPFMAISRKDIRSVKPIKIYEGEIYSPKERYRMKLAVSPPRSAENHFRIGEWCMANELVEEASDHFAKCQLLDDSYIDRCKDKMPLIKELSKKLQARKIYVQLLRDKAAGRYGKVLKAIDLLAAQYEEFEENTKLAMEKPIIEKKRKTTLRREVISLYHMYMYHFIEKCAYERKSDTPPIPMKVVYLKSGFPLEGKLKGSADGDVVTLENAGLTYKIKREHISRMETKLVEKGPFRWRTLAECTKYVSDRKGGITGDIQAAIGKDLEIEEKQVAQIWGKRLGDVFEVDGSGVKTPLMVTSWQDAHWSVGSWLRGGGKATGSAAGSSPGGRSTGGTSRRNPRNPRNPRGGTSGAKKQKWDDPETWWKKQKSRTKCTVLKAMCAEKIMKVEKVYRENCFNCGGTGHISVMNVGVGGTGGLFRYACHVCRGTGAFWGISYR
jgi:hypothetical protein